MAESYGIGTGIGAGISEFTKNFMAARQARDQERELRADKFEAQAKDIAANIQKLGGINAKEAAPYVQQLRDIVGQHNALYPPHETPALIQRIQRSFGGKPGAPRPDLRAGMTAEGVMAGAPLRANALLQERADFNELYRTMHPQATQKDIDDAFWIDFQAKHGPKPRGTARFYQSPDAKQGDWFYPGDPDIPEGWTARAPGARAAAQPGSLAFYLTSTYGPNPTPQQQTEGKIAWAGARPKREVKVGSLEDFLTKAFGDSPTSEQILQGRSEYAAAAAGTTTQERTVIHDNGDNTATVYQLETTTKKTFPGVEGQRQAPQTAPPKELTPQTTPVTQEPDEPRELRYGMLTPAVLSFFIKHNPQEDPAKLKQNLIREGYKDLTGETATPGPPEQTPPKTEPKTETKTSPAKVTTPAGGGKLVPGQVIPGKMPAAIESNINQARVVMRAGPKLIEQIEHFRNRLGPIQGRYEALKLWAGFHSDLQQLQTEMESFRALQPKFHGARGVSAIEFFYNASARLAQDPDNAIQAVRGLMEQSENFIKAGGREPEDPAPAQQGSDMIWVQIPGQQPGQIHASQWPAFQQKYKDARQLQAPQ
jgi:hypothetical protein